MATALSTSCTCLESQLHFPLQPPVMPLKLPSVNYLVRVATCGDAQGVEIAPIIGTNKHLGNLGSPSYSFPKSIKN